MAEIKTIDVQTYYQVTFSKEELKALYRLLGRGTAYDTVEKLGLKDFRNKLEDLLSVKDLVAFEQVARVLNNRGD